MRIFVIISLLFSLFNPLPEASKAQIGSSLEEARKGDQAYDAGEHEKALQHYESAEEKGLKDPKLRFNKGDALYQLEKYADAARAFRGTASGSDDPSLRAKAYHNLGNSHLKAGRLEKSIEAYKEALRLKPGDEDTRYNLALAKKLKKKSQQKNNKNQKDKKNKDRKKEKQDGNKKKDGKDGNKNEDQKGKKERKKDGKSGDRKKDDKKKGQKGDREKEQGKDQGKKQQAGKKGEKEKGEKKKKARALSPEEVKRLLKAMEANEAEVQRKLLRKKKKQKEGEKQDVEKDW